MKVLKVTNSAIKGYHIFKIKPHESIKMLVIPELNNSYDANAMLIQMPAIQDIDENLHEENTGKDDTKVTDIAGKKVGRVPANLAVIFRKLLTSGKIKSISCVSEGRPRHSLNPHFKQFFYKNARSGRDRRGGGAIIPCTFEINCYETHFEATKKFLQKSIKDLSEKATEQLVDENCSMSSNCLF